MKIRIIRSEIYFPIIIAVHLLLWALDLTIYDGTLTLTEGENPYQRVLGEVLSSWVITVFAFNLLMASRARWVERIFGGLDKMYLIHRRSAVIGMVLLFLHFAIVPRHPDFTIGKPLGFAAMVLIFLGVVLSAAPLFKRKIPYHGWLRMHRLMGPFYVIGVLHAYTVPTLISDLVFIRTYVFGMAVLGVCAWLYRVILHTRLHPRLVYEVTRIQRHGGAIFEADLQPKGKALDFDAGQFAFFEFPRAGTREAHPFTIASVASEESLRVAIKASGDGTAALQKSVSVGDPAFLEGPYGHFTQRNASGSRQVWVAGGIGITPFLALVRELEQTDKDVSLYWSVRTAEEAIFHDELNAAASRYPRFSYRLWESHEEGFLTAEAIPEFGRISDLEVLICGPAALRDSLTDQLSSRGLPARRILSEEFAFR